jgi:hypothetical protein
MGGARVPDRQLAHHAVALSAMALRPVRASHAARAAGPGDRRHACPGAQPLLLGGALASLALAISGCGGSQHASTTAGTTISSSESARLVAPCTEARRRLRSLARPLPLHLNAMSRGEIAARTAGIRGRAARSYAIEARLVVTLRGERVSPAFREGLTRLTEDAERAASRMRTLSEGLRDGTLHLSPIEELVRFYEADQGCRVPRRSVG